MKIPAAIFVAGLIVCADAAAQATAESAKLAAEVPIADVHMHLEGRFTPGELKALLDRNNVRWAGGVGPIGRGLGSDFRQGFVDALGERYIATLGQPELNEIYFSGGAGATADAGTAKFRALLERAEAEFKAGRIKGFGELFVNNASSNPNPQFRRKIATDAPTVRAMYEMAARHGGFVAMHMEADRDSLEQLDRLASIEPRATVILSHCGVWADAAAIRRVLERHPNVHCDLAWRSPPVARGTQGTVRTIFDNQGASPEWLQLIEAMPERFLIGTDAYCCDYTETIAVFRTGLLARLSPSALRKVAFENAQRLMNLR